MQKKIQSKKNEEEMAEKKKTIYIDIYMTEREPVCGEVAVVSGFLKGVGTISAHSDWT